MRAAIGSVIGFGAGEDRARRQHRQAQFLAVAQAHVQGFAGAAPVGRDQAVEHHLPLRHVAGSRAACRRADTVAIAQARRQRAREPARRLAWGLDVADFQAQAGTVGHRQVDRTGRGRHDLGRHHQLFGALEHVLVALLLDHALALEVGGQLGQCCRDQDTEQQRDEYAPRHRSEESFHADGSTVTWPAST